MAYLRKQSEGAMVPAPAKREVLAEPVVGEVVEEDEFLFELSKVMESLTQNFV